MGSSAWLSFLLGFLLAAGTGLLVRILVGLRLNLFLINHESHLHDQTIIPITTELKKSSLFRVIFNGNWREDVAITLMDDDSNRYEFEVGFHWWKRFFIYLKSTSGSKDPTVDFVPLREGMKMFLRTGQELRVGDRLFVVLVSASQMSLQRTATREEKLS